MFMKLGTKNLRLFCIPISVQEYYFFFSCKQYARYCFTIFTRCQHYNANDFSDETDFDIAELTYS